MGLLDDLYIGHGASFGGQGGGLLDFLRTTQMQQDQYQPSVGSLGQASPIGVGGYQMPRIGEATQFTPPPYDPAALPPNAQPTQGQLPMQSPQQPLPPALGGGQQASGPGFGDRLNASAMNFANAGGLLPALVGGVSGLLTGQRTDAQGVAQQNLKAQYESLVPMLGPQKAMLAVMNPEAGKILLAQALEKRQYGFQKMDDGTIVRTDPLRGTAEPAYSAGTKPTFGVVGEQDGQKVYGFIDPGKNKVTPYQAPGSETLSTVTGPDGKPISIPPGDRKEFLKKVADANAKAATGEKTEVQAKSEKFGNKMENAEKNISKVEDELMSYRGRSLDNAPLVGGTMATNWLQSDKYQKAKQARDNFITALLRDESGAAIGTQEFQRYEKELFPQPGDSQGVIVQKREARKIAIEAMKKSAGPGYKSPDIGSASAAAAPADPLGIR
jgi:hypothetical protein